MSNIPDELVERMVALVRVMAALRVGMSADREMLAARAIFAELPAPVDPDLIEAREMAAAASPQTRRGFIAGERDGSFVIRLILDGIKRGRELAARERGL